MKIWSRFLILASLLAAPSFAFGQEQESTEPVDEFICPISYELTAGEGRALKNFEWQLRRVNGHLGKDRFERKLQDILLTTNPGQKVIDVSPFFMEMALYFVDYKYLQDVIERTIGVAHPSWVIFEREMMQVLLYRNYGNDRDRRRFARASEQLIKDIGKVGPRSSRHFARRNYSAEEGARQKARAAAQVGSMYLSVESVRVILEEIARQRRDAFYAGLGLNLLRFGSAAVVIAATIYAGPIIGAAGMIAGRMVATDLITAANMARIGRTIAGGALGAVGAPAGQLAITTHSALTRARRDALNNRTTHACELDRQFAIWREQGVAPYLNMAMMGGSIGLVGTGAVYVLPRIGSNILLSLSTFGAGVTAAYAVGQVSYHTSLSLHEYELAVQAQDRGDTELAIEHLHRSRDYAAAANEAAIETILLGVLASSVGRGFKAALAEGKEGIAVIVANSADTLPLAAMVGAEIALEVSEKFQ